MKYSTDCKIREWQGRHDEIERLLYDIHKMDFFIANEDRRCASFYMNLNKIYINANR